VFGLFTLFASLKFLNNFDFLNWCLNWTKSKVKEIKITVVELDQTGTKIAEDVCNETHSETSVEMVLCD
jgi:hypothetical protein